MKTQYQFLLVFLLLALVLTGCAGRGGTDENQDAIAEGVSATQTRQAWEEEMESARETDEAAEEEAPADTPEPVVHTMVPEEPSESFNTFVTDVNSIDLAQEGIAYGDQFLINRYERPFTAQMVEYRGYLDLVLANMDVSPPWIYIDIYLADELPETSGAVYSLEFDTDEDGRGDYLVQALMPADGEWTVDGVEVYQDQDGDVGGSTPVIADEPAEGLTGFEVSLFQSGQGEDPDLAWVRRNPEDPTGLQIAIKQDLVGTGGFLWLVAADEGLRDPELADYNDQFLFEDAGSPFPEHQFYPIDQIFLIDSTCRSWYAYEPVGDEIGLCQVYAEAGPEQGWRLCVSLENGQKTCFDTCQKRCPDLDRLNEIYDGRYTFSCERCNLPEE